MNVHAGGAEGGKALEDDNALMLRAAAGDQQAFEILVLRHREPALRQAALLVGDRGLAEDIVQECFADLYLHRNAYRPDFRFTTFLSALVRHKSIDALRRKKRLPLLLPETPDAPGEETPESQCIRHEIYIGIFKALDSLDPLQRQMLLMFALDGMDYQQIANALHKTVPQVKVTLHRIRKKLLQAKEEWL